MSTISSLPTEVLAHTFLLCHASLSYSSFGLEFCKPDLSASPLLLTHVCSRWRHIVLDTSQLWSSLALDWDIDNTVKNARICQTWLGRSGTSHLSLCFTDTLYDALVGDESDDGTVSDAMLKAILPFQDRWKYLSLTFNHRASVPSLALLSQPPFFLSALDTLVLSGVSRSSTKHILLDNVQTLRRLSIGHGCDIPTLEGFPWCRLTHFECGTTLNIHAAVCILQECQHLTDLSLLLGMQETSRPHIILSLPRLERFLLDVRGTPSYPFLNALTLPRLNDFWYRDSDETFVDTPFRVVSVLLKRSGQPPLQKLVIFFWSGEMDGGHLLELFRVAPQLVQLEVVVNWPTSTKPRPFFGDSFVHGFLQPSLVPSLKLLKLHIPGCLDAPSSRKLVMGRPGLRIVLLEEKALEY